MLVFKGLSIPFNKLYIQVHIKLHVKKDNLKSIKLVFQTFLLKLFSSKATQMVIEANIGDSKMFSHETSIA